MRKEIAAAIEKTHSLVLQDESTIRHFCKNCRNFEAGGRRQLSMCPLGQLMADIDVLEFALQVATRRLVRDMRTQERTAMYWSLKSCTGWGNGFW